jgi:nucleotide-binding universal stress UspA family protein
VSAYAKVLVGLDGSEASAKGLAEAIRLAKADGAKLRIFHVVDELLPLTAASYCTEDVLTALRDAGAEIVAGAVKSAKNAGVAVEGSMVECVGGRTASLVVEEATRWGADLIVLGTHGRRGLRRLVMGSDAEEVVRTSPVPVLLTRSS